MRGTDGSCKRHHIPQRITPACAGNSFFGQDRLPASEDHPRVCGEQRKSLLCAAAKGGSPPRVRGTALVIPPRWMGYRITPACAGNRLHFVFPHSRLKDHPRVCGEQSEISATAFALTGSPPRVRGTVGEARIQNAGERITPACAGNSRR